jgi:hypothetical protein
MASIGAFENGRTGKAIMVEAESLSYNERRNYAATTTELSRCKYCGKAVRHSKYCPMNPYFKQDGRRKWDLPETNAGRAAPVKDLSSEGRLEQTV